MAIKEQIGDPEKAGKNKNAILVEALINRAGVEREALTLLKYIDADVYTGIYDPEATFEEYKKYNVKYFLKKKLPAIINPLYIRYKFGKLKLPQYKNFIFWGSHSLKAAKNNHPNMWYCNAPLRYIYDCYDEELEKRNLISKLFFRIFAFFMRRSDQKCFENIDIPFVNSRNVQKRIEKYYKSNRSMVLYPSVDDKNFKFLGQKDYYLICGRISPEKNFDLVVKAFQKMPDKKLVIAGDGPDKQKIMDMIKDYKNIKYAGLVSEEELYKLYGNCIAVVYVSHKEDLGFVPMESMTAGKPCIGNKDGGMKETIIHKKTGLLINPIVEEVIKAVKYITPKKALAMRKACEKRGKIFSEEAYTKGFIKNFK